MRKTLFLLYFICIFSSCEKIKTEDSQHSSPSPPTNQVLLSSEIKWEKLNPARGDKSPQAGTIWGDRKGRIATGFLAKFVDGFSSPPHIHNVSYRAVVLKGLIHNDDPNAERMWMPRASFWTQPAGEAHITSAKGVENIAYVEIDSGPYLVKPTDQAFDNGERPINIDINNMVWLAAGETDLIKQTNSSKHLKIAYLWQKDQMHGYLLRISEGFEGEIMSEGEEFRAIVIEGELSYLMPQTQIEKVLDPGSYFSSRASSRHQINVNKATATYIYIRTNDTFSIK
ncbi:MAG: DUF4437 domain-containing protein [Bacteroidota bacterium]